VGGGGRRVLQYKGERRSGRCGGGPPSLDATASAWAVDHDRGIKAGRGADEGHRKPWSNGSSGWECDLRSHGGAHLQLLLAPGGEGQHRADVLDAGL
jgi:hypothetical protein